MFIDTHAHLTGERLWPDITELINRANDAEIKVIVNICTDLITLERGLKLAEEYPNIYNAASTTPHDVEKEGELVFPHIVEQAKKQTLIAIGETGLDYYYEHSNKETQKLFLKKYLQLALEYHLPIIIHCREAFQDLFTILDSDYRLDQQYAPGILHCFTGTVQEAEELIKRDWYISLSGIVTFKKSEELRQVAQMVPIDRLLIETDSPYLAPQSKRGKVNEPAFLPETAAVIAEVRGIDINELAKQTTLNACRIFGLSPTN